MKTSIISAKRVAGGKVQLTFSQLKKNPNSKVNVLALANADDDRFNVGSARLAWMSFSPAIASEVCGTDLTQLEEGAEMELNVVEPTLGGHKLAVQIVESTVAKDEYQKENIIKTAKQYSDDEGTHYIVTAEKAPIFSNSSVVAEKDCKDVFAENTITISEDEFAAIIETADVKMAEKAN